jgi:hypothetical protein
MPASGCCGGRYHYRRIKVTLPLHSRCRSRVDARRREPENFRHRYQNLVVRAGDQNAFDPKYPQQYRATFRLALDN